MWQKYQCRLCGDIIGDHRQRRILHSEANDRVRHVLLELLAIRGPNKSSAELQQLISPADPSTPGLNQSYICKRTCFASLEKVLKTKEKITQLNDERDAAEKEVFSRLEGLYYFETDSDGAQLPPAKRPRLSEGSTPVPARRSLQFAAEPGKSPGVLITVGYKKPRHYIMTGSAKKVGKSLARGKKISILEQLIKNQHRRSQAAKLIGRLIKEEMRQICADKNMSILRETSEAALKGFSWETVWLELQHSTPLLMTILEHSFPAKSRTEKLKPLLCTCVSMLLKQRQPKMCHIQAAISMVLQAGHSGKQVFNRLQKLGLCLSPRATLRLLDSLGDGHDEKIFEWQASLVGRIEVLMKDKEQSEHQVGGDATFYGDIDDSFVASDDDFIGGLNLRTAEPQNLLGQHLEVSEPSSITSPEISPLSSLSSLYLNRSDSSQDGEVQGAQSGARSSQADEQVQQNAQSKGEGQSFVEDSTEHNENGSEWQGFKIIGDNIDKTVRPRHQTTDLQTQSLHYFNSYAVEDRIDFSSYSDVPPSVDTDTISMNALLPTQDDLKDLHARFAIHIARVLTRHLSSFSAFADVVPAHIKHKYSANMAKKSNVVPIGVYLQNENKLDEMCSIMEDLQQYCPVVYQKKVVLTPGESEPDTLQQFHYHPILFGGDQLTVARIRGSQRIRLNSEDEKGKLEGLVPCVEDWHTKVILLEVMWVRLYRKGTSMEGGTILQLKNLLNRSNVPCEVHKDVNATEDFVQVVLSGHIIAAAMEYFGMESLGDKPNPDMMLSSVESLTNEEKKQVLFDSIDKMVTKYINIALPRNKHQKSAANTDGVQEYAKEFLSLGLLYEEFEDSIREGDGMRVLQCWKFLLLLFKAGNRTNYSIEALVLLSQYHLFLSPRLAQQLAWSRFINTHGWPGYNIPCDLHMEHINRACKTAVKSLGANLTPKAIVRVGRCIGPLMTATQQFDKECGIDTPHGTHSKSAFKKDLQLVVKELSEKSKVFKHLPGRKHDSFKSLKSSMLEKLFKDELTKWMKYTIKRKF